MNPSLVKHQGFLLPMALFILLAGSILLGVMFRQVSQQTDTNLSAAFYDQSIHAAKAGAELTMSRVLSPLDSRQQADNRCSNISPTINYAVAGLQSCTISVSCECQYDTDISCNSAVTSHYNGSGATRSVYRVNATAVCGDSAYQGRSHQLLMKEYPN